jgi:hypothetical protein
MRLGITIDQQRMQRCWSHRIQHSRQDARLSRRRPLPRDNTPPSSCRRSSPYSSMPGLPAPR